MFDGALSEAFNALISLRTVSQASLSSSGCNSVADDVNGRRTSAFTVAIGCSIFVWRRYWLMFAALTLPVRAPTMTGMRRTLNAGTEFTDTACGVPPRGQMLLERSP